MKDMMDELIRDRETPNNKAPAGGTKTPRQDQLTIERRIQAIMAINLTPAATERVRHYIVREGALGLRLGVRKTGCSGWAYTVELADRIDAEDVVFEQSDVKVVVRPDSLAFLDGSTIDFVAEGLGSSFRFENPNVTEECGCGESFTIG
jgi:iron-sulfur cluster assembly protein